MPTKAFTPWWRLLHDRVATRSWCHTNKFKNVLSGICAICGVGGVASEDLYHFAVGCVDKHLFWQDVISFLSLQELLPFDDSIWLALTTFYHVSVLVMIYADVLILLVLLTVHLGSIISDASEKMSLG